MALSGTPQPFDPGQLPDSPLHVALVVARWNLDITQRLLAGAEAVLQRAGFAQADFHARRPPPRTPGGGASGAARQEPPSPVRWSWSVHWVPGSYELPLAARWLAQMGGVHAVVALGCVLRGETPHFGLVTEESFRGLMQVSLESKSPPGSERFGIPNPRPGLRPGESKSPPGSEWFGIPVAGGVLAAEDHAQALSRSIPVEGPVEGLEGKGPNRGAEACEAALEMLAFEARLRKACLRKPAETEAESAGGGMSAARKGAA